MKHQLIPAFSLEKSSLLSACVVVAIASTGAYAQSYVAASAQGQTIGNRYVHAQDRSVQETGNQGGFASNIQGFAGATPGLGVMSSSLPRVTNNAVRSDGRTDAITGSPRGSFSGDPRIEQSLVRQPSAFQRYVYDVTGTSIEVFGASLFSDVPDTFAPVGAAQVNPDYVVGSGDELQIRGWGMVDIDVNVTVDRSGSVHIPRVGAVRVAGIKYRDLQGHLKSAISKIFSNFELTATVAQTRAVQIYVVGHAVRPGTYTLSAMSTLLNALFASGGPSGTGSMRNIQLKRGNATVTQFDIYDVLVKGDKSNDVALQDGDVIYIPEVGPVIALTGDVKTPAVLELKGPSNLADVIGWAGGFNSAVDTKDVVVEKNINNIYQPITQVKADKGWANGPLAGIPVGPAEVLRVFSPVAVPVRAQIENEYVRVSGEIKQSGVFAIRKGETLRELISRLGGVTENGYVFATVVKRESVRQAQQIRLNQIADRFEREIEATAADRVAAVADEKNIAAVNAEVARQRSLAQKLRSVKAEGRIVLELEDGDAQVKNLPELSLQHGDTIEIPRKPGTVDVLGAVFQPATFIYKSHRNAGDYLDLAGGSTATADTSETYVIRADGTARSGRTSGWFSGINGARINAGDTIVVPEKIERETWMQSLREWTAIFYQFGLGAAGLKVLKD